MSIDRCAQLKTLQLFGSHVLERRRVSIVQGYII